MTRHDFYQEIANKTGDEIRTIEAIGFEMHAFQPNRKELRREKRLRSWRQQRRDKRLGDIAAKIAHS